LTVHQHAIQSFNCKVLVESKGPGVRAFEVLFHSAGIASHQFVHVNRGAEILGWVSPADN